MITVSKSAFQRQILSGVAPDTRYLEQEGFEEQLRRYRDGEFEFVGVRATVDLPVPYGKGFIHQRITTPGCWGIESDSDDGHFAEVFQEECDTLTEILSELNVQVV